MRSISLVVIICSTLLRTVPISTVPISTVPISTEEMGSTEPNEDFKTPSFNTETDATNDPSISTEEPKPTDPPTTTTEEPKPTDPPTTTTEEPEPTDAPTTTTPPVLCKDLEMDDSGNYGPQMGSIPKSPANNERVVPLNAIKLPKRSCKELYADGHTQSGLYIIKPGKVEVTVFCDMTLCGGGWTIIQRRLNKDSVFNATYADYQLGFGDLSSSYWSGLDTINALTSDGAELFVGMQAFVYGGLNVFAYYQSFSVGDSDHGYKLSVSGYNGNEEQLCGSRTGIYAAGDSLDGSTSSSSYHNGQKFSAIDRDEDQADKKNCAAEHDGGWWYNKCHFSDLNGDKIIWRSFLYSTSLDHSIMAVR